MFEFLNSKDLNMGLAKNKEAKWCVDRKKKKYVYRVKRPIDQKCTADVLTCVAAAIIDFTREDENRRFCVNDIWKSDFSSNYVTRYFKKPDPKTEIPAEYDKFFSMPIGTFEYAGIIKFVGRTKGHGKNNYFKIVNRQALIDIAQNRENSYEFLVVFLRKLVSDSHLKDVVDIFFEKQDEESYKLLKNKFYDYFKKKTNIDGEKEKGRIFTKIINVLALEESKRGSYRGHISKKPIDFSEIYYNRENWRFANTNKSKSISRKEFLESVEAERTLLLELNLDYSDSAMARAKRRLREYNELYRAGRSEVTIQDDKMHEKEAHHTFPQHEDEYKCIRACTENLVLLTSYQHDYCAHEDDKRYIKKDFQKVCISEKINRIEEYFESIPEGDLFDFDRLIIVLNKGFKTDDFTGISKGDYKKIKEVVERFYS